MTDPRLQRGGRRLINAKRDYDIRNRRARGETIQSIAKRYGISHQRVNQICKYEGFPRHRHPRYRRFA